MNGEKPFHKLLKDYPRDEWFEAADGCEVCGVKYQVQIVDMDMDGVFGAVKWMLKHKPECPEAEEDGEEWDVESAGWEYMSKPYTFRGRQYYPISLRANVAPCLNCGKIIIGTPLIIFIDKGEKGELDFCWSCVKNLKILERVRG
jgi:hypothetical protein